MASYAAPLLSQRAVEYFASTAPSAVFVNVVRDRLIHSSTYFSYPKKVTSRQASNFDIRSLKKSGNLLPVYRVVIKLKKSGTAQ